MQDSNIHLWSIFAITVRIVDFSEDFKAFFDLTENSVLPIHRWKVCFCQSDKKLTVVKIRTFISCGQISNFFEFEFMINLVVKVLFLYIFINEFPYGGGILRNNTSSVIWNKYKWYFFELRQKGRYWTVSSCIAWWS